MESLKKFAPLAIVISVLIWGNLPAQFNPQNGLVVYMPFSGSPTDVISNAVGELRGTDDVGPALVEDRFGKAESAYYFDSSLNQGIFFNDTELNLPLEANPRTLSAWIKSDNAVKPMSDCHIICYGEHTNYNNTHLAIRPNGIIRFGFWSLDTDGKIGVSDDEWHNIVGVMDGISAAIYVDGVLDTLNVFTDLFPATILDADNIMTVGIIGINNWAPTIGTIDEVRIYDIPLAADEVAALYNYSETDVKNRHSLKSPDAFTLGLNYPNPFNPSTSIGYSLNKAGKVSLDILNVKGQVVQTVVDQIQGPGQYAVKFNGESMDSGIYLYRLRTENGVRIRKMTLQK
jgi:hypothetical protein